MEAAAMDKLIEKGRATPQLAQAIGEALDITLKAANLVTVAMLDTRFAQFEAKMEARFGAMELRFSSLERTMASAIETAKVWAVLLYAGLAIAFFGALAVDHRWLLNREDQFQARSDTRFAADEVRSDKLIAEENARTNRLFAEDHARTDKLIAEDQARTDKLIAQDHALIAEGRAQTDKFIAEDRARTDKLIAEQQAHADKVEARTDAKLDQLRSLLLNHARKP